MSWHSIVAVRFDTHWVFGAVERRVDIGVCVECSRLGMRAWNPCTFSVGEHEPRWARKEVSSADGGERLRSVCQITQLDMISVY